MRNRILSSLFLLLFCSTALAHQQSSVPASLDTWIATAKKSIIKKVLPNGITVLFYPLAHTCVVDIRATINVGSRHERDGQFGLAHMVEHMIFKGTQSMSEIDLKRIAEKYGNTGWNAMTTMDETSYFFQTDNKHWPIFLSIMADCMSNVRFDENHFTSEVKTVISELNLNRANPVRKMTEAILINSFGLSHPYHHSPIGTREDLLNSSAQDLKNFYQAHYTPEQTVLTITGNIDPEELFKKIDEYFGVIAPTQNPSPRGMYDPQAFFPTDFIQKNTIIHTQIKTPCTMLYWIVPGQKSQEASIGEVLYYILNERIKKLKDMHDFVYSCQAFMIGLFDAGIFGCSFEPKTETVQNIRFLIENEIHDLMYNGPTDNEIAQFKILERNGFANGFENINFVAEMLKCYCLNNNEYEIFDRFEFIQNLKKNDIKNFCKTYLCRNLSNSIECVPLQDKEKASWMAMQEKIDIYEQKLLSNKDRQTVLEEELLIGKLPAPEQLDINFPEPDRTVTLSNGLTVYIKQRSHAPGIVLLCKFYNQKQLSIYHALHNKSQIPILAMSLLKSASLGSQDHPEEFNKKEHSQFFDTLGAEYSISYAGATLRCLPCDLEAAATRLLHILTKPTYPQDSFSLVIDNAIQRITMNKQDPAYRAYNYLAEYLYQGYPWIQSDEQLIADLKGHSRQDLYDFHKQYVTPHGMYLTLIGNIDPDDAVTHLENIFGSWKGCESSSNSIMQSIVIPEITNPTAQDITIPLPKEQVTLLAGRLTTKKGTDQARALLLIEGYLNRMLFNIREHTGLFYTCHASLAPSSFITINDAYITTTIAPSNVEQTKRAIKAALQDLCDHGIPEDYLAIAKQNYRAAIAKSFATNGDLITGYGNLITHNQPFNYFNDQAEKIDTLTLEQVNAVARIYCAPETWTFIQAGPLEHMENLETNATP